MHLRAPEPDDALAVFEVIRERDLADLGFADFTFEDLREEWSRSSFDLATDAVLIEHEAHAVVGYAAIRRTHSLAVVAPAHEGKGAGTLLRVWVEKRERELARQHHRQGVASTDTRAKKLLLDAGYSWERSYSRMQLALEHRSPPAQLPGVTLRALEPMRDARAVYDADALSFADSADYIPMSFATFLEEHLQGHDLAAELSAVAESDGELIGFLLARRWQSERVGFVDVLAVSPPHQRRGVGTALLRRAFALFAAAGLREAQLGVASSNPRALALYERLGMSPRFRIDTYVRSVSGASDAL